MDMGSFSLFIKMVRDEYKLDDAAIRILTDRLLADGQEFESVWHRYKSKASTFAAGVDHFRPILHDLLN